MFDPYIELLVMSTLLATKLCEILYNKCFEQHAIHILPRFKAWISYHLQENEMCFVFRKVPKFSDARKFCCNLIEVQIYKQKKFVHME